MANGDEGHSPREDTSCEDEKDADQDLDPKRTRP